MAPLGTALSEEQILALWRLAPEPVLCFDGDNAGQRAAWRAAALRLKGLSASFGAVRLMALASRAEAKPLDSAVLAQIGRAISRL